MKLKTLAMLILGITIANTVLANEKPKSKSNYQEVVNGFMQSYLNNDHKKLKTLLSENAIYSFNRDIAVIKYDATAIISEMKKNSGIQQQNCDVSSKIITATEALVMAQVDISYAADNKQKNYLVLEKDKNGDWKITNVYKFYIEDKKEVVERKNITV